MSKPEKSGHRFYIYRLDRDGLFLTRSNALKAEDQTEALRKYNASSTGSRQKGWHYTLVLESPVHPRNLEYDHDFEYWVYNQMSRPLPMGEGPVIEWLGEADENAA